MPGSASRLGQVIGDLASPDDGAVELGLVSGIVVSAGPPIRADSLGRQLSCVTLASVVVGQTVWILRAGQTNVILGAETGATAVPFAPGVFQPGAIAHTDQGSEYVIFDVNWVLFTWHTKLTAAGTVGNAISVDLPFDSISGAAVIPVKGVFDWYRAATGVHSIGVAYLTGTPGVGGAVDGGTNYLGVGTALANNDELSGQIMYPEKLMGGSTAKGLPYPYGSDYNNVPVDLAALAARIDAILDPHTYLEIDGFAPADRWDGRILYQSDTGATRPWVGLYIWKTSQGAWCPLCPTGAGAAWNGLIGVYLGFGPNSQTGIGAWTRIGSTVFGQFGRVLTGADPGNPVGNVYLVPLPAPRRNHTNEKPIGAGLLWRNSVPRVIPFICYGFNVTPWDMMYMRAYGTDASVGLLRVGGPFTLTTDDVIVGYVNYEAAEA